MEYWINPPITVQEELDHEYDKWLASLPDWEDELDFDEWLSMKIKAKDSHYDDYSLEELYEELYGAV